LALGHDADAVRQFISLLEVLTAHDDRPTFLNVLD
jgi:hypothetical protein